MNKMIEQIKEIHKDAVCLYKVGTFYHAYGRDACANWGRFSLLKKIL